MSPHPRHHNQPVSEWHEVVQVIGMEAAGRLMNWRRGKRLYVPTRVNSNHELAVILGMPVFTLLVDEFSGMIIDVPLGKASAWQGLRGRALSMLKKGESTSQTAATLGIARRTLQRWKKKTPRAGKPYDDAQGNFDF